MNLSEARAEKRCPKCGETKSLDAFGLQINGKTPRGYCRPCQSAHSRAWQIANPQRHAEIKHASFVKGAKRFSLWKLDGSLNGLYEPYCRAVKADPCSYCGGRGGNADHIFPLVDPQPGRQIKPPSEWSEITGACARCNISKGSAVLLEFLGWPRGWLSRT